MLQAINLKDKFSKLDDFWSPRVLAELDGAYYAKIAKLKGDFCWHKHDNEDELFIVVSGTLKMEFEDKTVELSEGEILNVPAGTMHNPIAEEECHVVVIEKKSTAHTGDTDTARTKSIEDQLRPI